MGRSKAIRVSRAQIPANPHKIQALTHSCATHENPPSLFSTIYTLPRSTFAIDVLCSLAIANSGGRGVGGGYGPGGSLTDWTGAIPVFNGNAPSAIPDGFAGACGTLRSRHQSSQIPIPSGPVTAPIPLGPVTAKAHRTPGRRAPGNPTSYTPNETGIYWNRRDVSHRRPQPGGTALPASPPQADRTEEEERMKGKTTAP